MLARSEVIQEIENLNDDELQQVAEFLEYIRFRSLRSATACLSNEQITALYREAVDEDRSIAESGMAEYYQALLGEDIV